MQAIYPGNVLGGSALYLGLTLGDILEYDAAGTFVKADYPGLRAIRIDGGPIILATDLAASEDITPAFGSGADAGKGVLAVATRDTNLGIFTAEWGITGLSFTVTLDSNRIYYVHSVGHAVSTVAATYCIARIKIGGATVFEAVNKPIDGVNQRVAVDGYLIGPTSGSAAFTVTYTPGAGNMTFGATSTRLAYLAIEDKGPVDAVSKVELLY